VAVVKKPSKKGLEIREVAVRGSLGPPFRKDNPKILGNSACYPPYWHVAKLLKLLKEIPQSRLFESH
jgi:hypothetical protein